ncbi:MAG: alpha-glucosidase [Candidatus Hermodarchaeota archaeon]
MSGVYLKWWQKTVVYQIYPRSYKDTSGNGIGDLKGIFENLDYLEELGVETIWFNPFFNSPQRDHGYDVSDFRSVDPIYGTMRDFDKLLHEIHHRNMKIVLDIVLNHTSDEHPWFRESVSSKNNPKRDWYIWRDGKKPKGKKPPNNWKAIPGGSAWRYFNNTDQWVYFHFLPFQPDLNYRNTEVKEEMFNTLRFWLDKGVDGFRLDILHSIFEDANLKNDEFCLKLFPSEKSVASLFRKHKYDLNLPETFDFALQLRKVIDEYEPERFLVGEVFGNIEELAKYYGPNNDGLHSVFLFKFASTAPSFKPRKISRVISQIEKALPPPFTPTYVYGNHDRDRYISLINKNIQKAKLLATMQLTLRGIPFIYYGEEIGMSNVDFKLKDSQDPIGQKFSFFPIPLISKLFGFSLTRDRCRTPMQWNSELNAGFSVDSQIKPWLRVSETYKKVNVKMEKKNPSSLFNCYKRLLKARKANRLLQEGKFEFLTLKGSKNKCLVYRRYYLNEQIFVILNFSKKERLIKSPIHKPSLLFSTLSNRVALDLEVYNGNIKLTPLEGIIFK